MKFGQVPQSRAVLSPQGAPLQLHLVLLGLPYQLRPPHHPPWDYSFITCECLRHSLARRASTPHAVLYLFLRLFFSIFVSHRPVSFRTYFYKSSLTSSHQCTQTIMFVVTVCRHHIQPQLCFNCERDITSLLSCHLPHPGLEEAQPHARAVQQNRSTVTGKPCCLTEGECIRGEGQVRMPWALNRKASRHQYQLL